MSAEASRSEIDGLTDALKRTIALAIVGFECVICGIFVSPNRPFSTLSYSLGGALNESFTVFWFAENTVLIHLVLLAGLSSIPYLVFRNLLIATPLDRPLSRGAWLIVSILLSLMLGMFYFGIQSVPKIHFLFFLGNYLILGVSFFLAYQRKKSSLSYREEFINSVLIPAVCYCSVLFSMGLYISDNALPGTNSQFNGSYLAILLLPILLIYLFYSRKIVDISKYMSFVFVFMLIPFFLFFLLPDQTATVVKNIFVCLILVFSIGVAEVVLLTDSYPHGSTAKDYYVLGANWAVVVFIMSLILVPAMVIEMHAPPICIFSVILIALWYEMRSRDKNYSKQFGLLAGYLIPIVLIVSFLWVPEINFSESVGGASLSGSTLFILLTLVAFNAGILRLIKDMVGFNLSDFSLNIWDLETYREKTSIVFLVLHVSILLNVFLLFAWIILISPSLLGYSEYTLDIESYDGRILFCSSVLTLIAVLTALQTFIEDKRLEMFRDRQTMFKNNKSQESVDEQ